MKNIYKYVYETCMRPSVFCFGFAFPRGLNLVFVQQSINLPPSNMAGISEGKDGHYLALVEGEQWGIHEEHVCLVHMFK